MARTSIQNLTLEHLLETGLSEGDAQVLLQRLACPPASKRESQIATWDWISRELLCPEHPFKLHQLLFSVTYLDWDARRGPPIVWKPTEDEAKRTNIGTLIVKHEERLSALGASTYDGLLQLSNSHPEVYWPLVFEELGIRFHKPPTKVLESNSYGGTWLRGAELNVAECCLVRGQDIMAEVALIWRDEGNDEAPLQTMTLGALRAEASCLANSLLAAGFQTGDAIAIDMPMNQFAVIAYLGTILAGCVVVSIADSFAPSEIATRLRLSEAKGIFTQDVIIRGSKSIPLYSRVTEAGAPRAIVLPAASDGRLSVELRNGDLTWGAFLEGGRRVAANPGVFEARSCPAEATTNILFSSGTTGDPKAIPWTHVTPLKAGADAWAHQDVRKGDVVAWPTNLGWMMGPWLIYAALLNGAAIALYNGAPGGRGFAKFVQDAKVTMLGLVPSIAKAWRSGECVKGLGWSHVRCFSSSGEASNADDYLWLTSRVRGYRPVIEYCGGTEIGGGFVTGSMLQPQALSAFSTPAMGCTVVILDENQRPYPSGQPCVGECALLPPMLGASTRLLNADHHKVYFKGMPRLHNGRVLRRHGDEMERLPGGFYRAHGRVDDTMNLGGIKVSSVEIERVCNAADLAILETAAIGIPPPDGGPEQLLIVAVLKDGHVADTVSLTKKLTSAVAKNLNPLFRVSRLAIAPVLPRTASNKIMRRILRDQYGSSKKNNIASGRAKL
ncbi:acyl-activating enzyme [Klebsormidium nitens]|uniref:Acyl-activating enzyme n=1 Tax=Klebsormidium nitens TaxID=105231 RepID=A0A1Y1IKU5_KLENI|nr:acyl-activating enzyme [Klebsormidium nitens]|eukprot:GAQ91495.1 acyl-activating enzyme [Klebsormidium nitens]